MPDRSILGSPHQYWSSFPTLYEKCPGFTSYLWACLFERYLHVSITYSKKKGFTTHDNVMLAARRQRLVPLNRSVDMAASTVKPRTVRPSPLKKKEKTQHSQNYIYIHINIYRMVAIYPPHLPTRRYHPPHRQHARPNHRLCPSRARNGDGPVFDRVHAGGYLWICVGR